MSKCTRAVSTETAMMLLLALIVLLGLTSPGKAQTLDNTFEIDSVSGEGANAIDEAAKSGTDWDSLYTYWLNNTPYPAGWDLDVYTGVIADYGILDTTRFGEGTKDIQDIPAWAWQALPPNDKVDITNAQAALFSPGSGNLFLYMEADRFSNLGDAAMGLWLLQDSSFSINSDGTFSGHHIAGTPGPGGQTGDLLILAHYTNGGGVDSIAVYEWVGAGGNSDNLFGSQGSDAFDVVTKTPSQAFATVNDTIAHAPWPYLSKNGTTDFEPFSFFEGALDLGTLLGGNVPCFAKFLFETRESQSLTSALKDFGLGSFSTTPVVSVNSDTVCAGGSAQLCATVEPGTGISPFTYSWVGPGGFTASTSCITVSVAGSYGVVVTGDNGCASDTIYGTLTVQPKPDLSCSGDLLTCDSTLASAHVTVNNSASLGTISYVWSPAPVSGQGTATARYSSPGTKKVVVTSGSGCVDSCEATITQDNTPPSLTCSGDKLTCDSTLASASVVINNPGDMGATITYVWSPAPVSGQGTATARYSSPGTKKVVVTDVETGCKDSCTATITQDITAPNLTCSGDKLTCDSTLASASVVINNPGDLGATITYVWSPAPVSGQGTATARYSAPGTKKVVVTDVETGCKDSCNATITQDITAPNLTCSGDVLTCDSTLATAHVTVNNPGDLGATITYVWSPAPVSGQGTATARYSDPGTKKVVVTDVETGCKDSCEATITRDANVPDLTCSGDLLTCDSTLATAHVTVNNPGDLGTLTYVWSPAPVSGQGTATARYSAPGLKKVVVTDTQSGCKDSCEANITQDITGPNLTCSGDKLTCDSTLASASVVINNPGDLGATITYVWSPAPVSGQGTATARYSSPGVKKVVVKDVETGCKDSCEATITQDITAPNLTCSGDKLTCDSTLASASVVINNPGDLGATITYVWSPAPVSGQGTATARYSSPGVKKVVVTDVETGCKDSCEATITQDIVTPNLTCSGDVLTCDSTLATAHVTVNNPGDLGATITYVWSPAPVSGQGTATARYDAPGTKKVVVTDVETGCKDSCEATITRTANVPDLTCVGDLLTCDSTQATAHVTVNNQGDLGTLTYVWSPAPVSGQGTATARYSSPGLKKVVVTDTQTGCKDSCEANITQDNKTPNLTCSGDVLTCDSTLATASVVINNPGDLGATITYVWSPDPVSGQGTATARYDAAGTKKVVVTDVETGCKDSCNAEITSDKEPPVCSVSPADSAICPPGNVTFCVSASGGKSPYTYSWSGPNSFSSTDSCINASDSGTYQVVVTGTNGCKDTCVATLRYISCAQPCTFTMGGWGSDCPASQAGDSMSTQPGCIRDYYFSRVFPNGVIVGDQGGPFDGDNRYAAKWTTAAAINAFLPAGQTPKVFNKDYTVNPVTTNAGVAAGQILALKLNVGFSCAGIFIKVNPNNDGSCYGSFVIPDTCGSKFAGLTVDQFLVIADLAISGDPNALTPYHAKISDVNNTATCLNQLFDGCDPTVVTQVLVAAPEEEEEVQQLPSKFELAQNYPNPFNPTTVISYSLPTASHVKIEVFNMLGQRVATLVDDSKDAGTHTVTWNASDKSSGIYLYRLTTDQSVLTRKMLLIK